MGLVLFLFGGIAALAVIAIAWYALIFRRPLPRVRGELRVEGLGERVRIRRDSLGRATVVAGSWRDAAFAAGFVHGQDRLWQIELMRRTAAGRLSELFGEATLASDRLMKRAGLRRISEAEWHVAHVTSDVRPLLDAYSDGVNAAAGDRPLPAEFRILRFRPEPWEPVDSLSVLRLAGLDRRWLDETRAGELIPAQAGAGMAVRAATRGRAGGAWLDAQIGGAPTIPSALYELAIELPDDQIEGLTLCGLPFVVLGRNHQIAWALAETERRTQDLFQEELNPNNPMQYRSGAQWEDGLRYREAIAVRGRAAVTETVLVTHRGPLVGAALRERSPNLALRWVALNGEVDSVSWLMRLNRAHDWPGFRAAIASCPAPIRKASYADARGNIGWRIAGFLPLQDSPEGGLVGQSDWQGFTALEDVPEAFNDDGGEPPDPPQLTRATTFMHLVAARHPLLGPLFNRTVRTSELLYRARFDMPGDAHIDSPLGASGQPASRDYVRRTAAGRETELVLSPG